MAKLGSLTKKVAGAVVSGTKTVGNSIGSKVMSVGRGTAKVASGVVGGITKGVGRGVGSVTKSASRGVSQALDLDALRPSNILSASMESVGLSALTPAFTGRGDGGRSRAAARVAEANRLPAKGGNISTATLEKLLEGLININEKILENSNVLINYAKNTNSILQESNELTKKKMLTDLENMRESKKPTAANDNKVGAIPDKGGKGMLGTILGITAGIAGFFGGLLKTAKEIVGGFFDIGKKLLGFFSGVWNFLKTSVLAIIEIAEKIWPYLKSFIFWVGRLFATIGRFLIANPIVAAIGLAIAAIASLKEEDWTKFFGNFTKIFTDLAEGKFLDAIIRTVTAIPELIIKALGRMIANILGFFGFKDAAKAIDDFLDNFDLAQIVIDFVDGAINYISEFVSTAGKAMGEFFGPIKDWVVQKFTDASKAFSDWWTDFHPLDAILDFFKNVKNWVVTKFTEAVDAFSKWWEEFSIIDIVLTPFRYIKEKAVSVFDDLLKTVTDVLSFDLVGKISNSISSLINSVWGFFKALPGKAMDLIGGFIPDSLKNLWSSVFGNSAPTAQPNTTPAITPQNNITPTLSGRSMAFNQQSSRMATEQSGSPVVIVNNNTNVNSTGSGSDQNPLPRTSGSVSTAPQSSHIDRALYGNHYGTGVP